MTVSAYVAISVQPIAPIVHSLRILSTHVSCALWHQRDIYTYTTYNYIRIHTAFVHSYFI